MRSPWLFGWMVALAMVPWGTANRAMAQSTEHPDGERPHVLFISIDDLNDWVTHLGGHPQAATPHIDALAARGVRFSRAYCNAPLCNPSRTALLTGIAPHTSGVLRNRADWRAMLPEAVTLPAHFRANGYHTLGCGKIFHHSGDYNDLPAWEAYFPWEHVAARDMNGLDRHNFDWGASDDLGTLPDEEAVSWAIDKLHHPTEEPMFLAVGIYRPHLPWYVPQEYFDRFPLDEIQLPEVIENDLSDIPAIPLGWAGSALGRTNTANDHPLLLQTGLWKNGVQAYLASIAYADDQVGRLMEAFDASSIADNTVIVLWSDHGWHLGEKEHWRKYTLWEDACRVPMAFVAPEVTTPGGECGRTVSLMNIYPTLCDLCGLTPPEHVAEPSIRSLLADPEAPWQRPAITTYLEGNHSVRTERWRYTRYHDGTDELYDHDTDPHEWHNLAEQPEHAEVIEQLRALLPE